MCESSEARNVMFQVSVVLTVIGYSLFASCLLAKLTTTIVTYRHKSHVRISTRTNSHIRPSYTQSPLRANSSAQDCILCRGMSTLGVHHQLFSGLHYGVSHLTRRGLHSPTPHPQFSPVSIEKDKNYAYIILLIY